MIQYLFSWIALILIYVLVLGNFQPLNFLVGGILAFGLLAAFRTYVFEQPPQNPGRLVQRIVAFIPYSLATLKQILTGSWTVALISTGLKQAPAPGIVAIPMGDQTRTGSLIFGLTMSLSPTSILVQLDWDQRQMLFHVLDASHPDQTRQKFVNFYQHYQRPVFP